ncbi:MAG: hypothetical protein IJE17_12025, partial [Clostridia bacterium]|nr:hypothetical protein [Clostridia bacterium]
VSHRWLTTRYQSPKHPVLPDAATSPTPILLPVVISPEDTLSVLDDLMALALPNPRSMLQNDSFFRQSLKAVMMLHQLQVAQLQKNGQEELAEQHRQRFKQLREERVAYWMKELHITEPDLKESAITV